MRRSIAAMKISCLAGALMLAACAHQPPAMDVPASLAAAETAFAAHSVREDMRAAFLAAFADDGVFVRNAWVVSNTWLASRPAPPIVLDWRPQYVEVAASGELGLSTGPWKLTSKENPDGAASYGQFVSIWRRGADGRWRVEVDLGISHPEPTLWKDPLEARTVPAASAAKAGTVEEAEAAFQRLAAASGLRAAYEAHGAQDLRLYRSGTAPRASRAAALSSPALKDEKLAWTVDRSATARSGDLAYTRGACAQTTSPPVPVGFYLRVWRREAAGWRIVLDVVNPVVRS
jgi:ketosteroid isomerase-like protein